MTDTRRVGVMIIGLTGAVGSTVVVGAKAMAAGLSPPIGMLSETGTMPERGRLYRRGDESSGLIRDALGLAHFEDLCFGGWDLRSESVADAASREQIVSDRILARLTNELGEIRPFPALTRASREAVDAVRKDIAGFRKQHGLSQVVVVDLRPTAPTVPRADAHLSLAAFERAIDAEDSPLTPSMLYFYAACQEGASYVNFTPNIAEIPALVELAAKNGIPHAGRDGKTGQTLLKTALAPCFRDRQLRIRGWYSANILGNADGRALADPAARATKVKSKSSALESILGYEVSANGLDGNEPSHVVTIDYYPPRRDNKESWDSIDIEGFLGSSMQLKINFLCKDSILAAPIVLDLARFMTYAHRRGESGVQDYLGLYFKSPLATSGDPVHDFFEQVQRLANKIADWSK